MKKITSLTLVFLLGILVLSCNKDDDNKNNSSSNFLSYDDVEYELKSGIIENYGDWLGNGTTNFDVTLFDSEISFSSDELVFENTVITAIYFELFSGSTQDLATGTYAYTEDDPAANTFEFADIIIKFNVDDDTYTAYPDITSGTFKVLSNGPTYEFEFEGMTEDNLEFSGHYKGSMESFDYSDETFRGIQKGKIKKAKQLTKSK